MREWEAVDVDLEILREQDERECTVSNVTAQDDREMSK